MTDKTVKAVLFDLGNTLVSYYKPDEFWPVLSAITVNIVDYLARHDIKCDLDKAHARVVTFNHEDPDHKVMPLLPRLQQAFELSEGFVSAHEAELVRCFLAPVFNTARLNPQAVPVLAKLKQHGYLTGIVSNTPWGSPAANWREELHRLGLDQYLDTAVFCTDVGMRKPDPAIFRYALDKLALRPKDTWFVGDDERWDVWGAEQIGMQAVLLDPTGSAITTDSVLKIRSLSELLTLPGIEV